MRKIAATAVVFLLAVMMTACAGGSAGPSAMFGSNQVVKVEISESRGFGVFHAKPFLTFEGEDAAGTIERIARAIREAEKQPGIVDIAAPEYDVRLTYRDGSTEAFHLWLDARYEHATIMDVRDTHYIYRVSAESTKDLLEIIGE